MSSLLIEEALGHPAKIRILRALRRPGAGYMSLNQLAKATSLNAMTLSRTLQSLQKLRLTHYVQAGTAQLWRLAEGHTANVIIPILDSMERAPHLIDQIKDTVLSTASDPNIKKIILYGSVARGENDANSDIDLFILQSKVGSKKSEKYVTDLIAKLSKMFWMTPSFLVKTPKDFKKMSPHLRQNIQEGIILYEKEKNQRSS